MSSEQEATTDETELVSWALVTAAALRSSNKPSLPPGTNLSALHVPAVAFLSQYAGEDSAFYKMVGLARPGFTDDMFNAGNALIGWADFVDAGLASGESFDVRARTEAADDLMDQVHVLLHETDFHPAAAVVLAGAALEERLRGLLLGTGQPLPEKPGLSKLASVLRAANVIDKGQEKGILFVADLRNEAAHGQNLDEVTRV